MEVDWEAKLFIAFQNYEFKGVKINLSENSLDDFK